jgi:hypothetical protein
MLKDRFVCCYDVLERRFFEVGALYLVPIPYRRNFYKITLKACFYEGEVDFEQRDEMKRLCYTKITNLMTERNIWQDHHSFYLVEYEAFLMPRKNNEPNEQNDMSDESSDAHSVSTANTSSSFEDDDEMDVDSAYGSPSHHSDASSHDTSQESLHLWVDESFEDRE